MLAQSPMPPPETGTYWVGTSDVNLREKADLLAKDNGVVKVLPKDTELEQLGPAKVSGIAT